MRKVSIPFYVSTLGALLLLAACQTAPVRSTGASTAATGALPGQPAAGAVHYKVDAAHSDVRFLSTKPAPSPPSVTTTWCRPGSSRATSISHLTSTPPPSRSSCR